MAIKVNEDIVDLLKLRPADPLSEVPGVAVEGEPALVPGPGLQQRLQVIKTQPRERGDWLEAAWRAGRGGERGLGTV